MADYPHKPQSYEHHVFYYPPYHFVFLPILFALFAGSAWCIRQYPEQRLIWIAITAVFFMMGFMALLLRQHYGLGNQDRTVRLELRLRYYQITGQRLEPIEAQLTFNHLAALRFASDEELPELIQQALKEKLAPKDIKQRIKVWLPDNMRL